MNLKKRMLSLKAIKLLFDTVLVLIVLAVVTFVGLVSFEIVTGDSSVSGYAKFELLDNPFNSNDAIEHTEDNVKSSLIPMSVTAHYEVFSEQHKTLLLIWKLLYTLIINFCVILLLFVLYQIRNIIKNVAQMMKDESLSISSCVFSQKNIRRLRYIAYGFMITPILELATHCIDGYFLERFIKIDNVTVVPDTSIGAMSWEYILVGLLFFAMIEVFRRGIVLQEENELTV